MFAEWGARTLIRLSPVGIPRTQQMSLDLPVLLFTMALAIGTAPVFGVIPLFVAAGGNTNETLKASAKSMGAAPRTRRLRDVLVIAEVALALILLIGAGLGASCGSAPSIPGFSRVRS